MTERKTYTPLSSLYNMDSSAQNPRGNRIHVPMSPEDLRQYQQFQATRQLEDKHQLVYGFGQPNVGYGMGSGVPVPSSKVPIGHVGATETCSSRDVDAPPHLGEYVLDDSVVKDEPGNISFRQAVINCYSGDSFNAHALHTVLNQWKVSAGDERFRLIIRGLIKSGYNGVCDFSEVEEKCSGFFEHYPQLQELHAVFGAVFTTVKTMSALSAFEKLPKTILPCASNVRNSFKIPDSHPFKAVYVNDCVRKFVFSNKKTTESQLEAVYKHILGQITDPPETIKKYTYRTRNLQDVTDAENSPSQNSVLLQLPSSVADVLLDYGIELLGFREEEISSVKHSISSLIENDTEYWRSLGENNEKREEKLLFNRGLVVAWRITLRTSLAKALKQMRGKTPTKQSDDAVVWKREDTSGTKSRAVKKLRLGSSSD